MKAKALQGGRNHVNEFSHEGMIKYKYILKGRWTLIIENDQKPNGTDRRCNLYLVCNESFKT